MSDDVFYVMTHVFCTRYLVFPAMCFCSTFHSRRNRFRFLRLLEMPQQKRTTQSSQRYWDRHSSRLVLRSTNVCRLNSTRAARRSELHVKKNSYDLTEFLHDLLVLGNYSHKRLKICNFGHNMVAGSITAVMVLSTLRSFCQPSADGPNHGRPVLRREGNAA